jgi:hypothetical protein
MIMRIERGVLCGSDVILLHACGIAVLQISGEEVKDVLFGLPRACSGLQ